MKRKYVDERGYVEYDPDGAPGREDFVWPEAKPLPKRKEKIFERWRPRKNPWNVFTDEPIRDWRLNWRYPEWHLQGLLKDIKEARELYSFSMRRKDVWIEDDKERFMKLYGIWLRSNGPKKHQPRSKVETAADVLASLSDYREVETAADVLAAIRNDPGLLKESAEDVLAAVRQEDISDYVGQGTYKKNKKKKVAKAASSVKKVEPVRVRPRSIRKNGPVGVFIELKKYSYPKDADGIAKKVLANPGIPVLFRCIVNVFDPKGKEPDEKADHHVSVTYLPNEGKVIWADPNGEPWSPRFEDWYDIYSRLQVLFDGTMISFDQYDPTTHERIKQDAKDNCFQNPDAGVCTGYQERVIPVINPAARFLYFKIY